MKHGKQIRLGGVMAQLEELLAKNAETVNQAMQSPYKRQGVYAFSDPADAEIIYVGRTTGRKGGLVKRLKGHLSAPRATLYKEVNGNQALAKTYNVRVLEEDDDLKRRNLEALSIAILSPRLNK